MRGDFDIRDFFSIFLARGGWILAIEERIERVRLISF